MDIEWHLDLLSAMLIFIFILYQFTPHQNALSVLHHIIKNIHVEVAVPILGATCLACFGIMGVMDVDWCLDLLSPLLLFILTQCTPYRQSTRSRIHRLDVITHNIGNLMVARTQQRAPPPPQVEIKVVPLNPNDFNRWASLAPEVLGRIFEFVRLSKRGYIKPRLILPVTWVCRRWRVVALSHAILWTHIDVSNMRWAAECLKRSKQALLDINLKRVQGYLIPFLLVNLPRIRRVHVSSSQLQPPLMAGQPVLWQQRAPYLMSLDMKNQTLPLDIFLGSCRRLETLVLRRCNFTWNTQWPVFAKLTILTIECPKTKVLFDSFLAVLRKMPNLQWLDLKRALLPFKKNCTELPHVYLYDLLHLHLSGVSPRTAINFVDRVHFSTERACAWIDCDWLRTSDSRAAYEHLWDKLIELYPVSSTLHIIQMNIQAEKGNLSFRYTSGSGKNSFILGYPKALNPTLSHGLVPASAYLLNLQTLVLRLDNMVNLLVWRTQISMLPLLEHLEFSPVVASSFHLYIAEDYHNRIARSNPQGISNQIPKCFPSLRTLKYIGLPQQGLNYNGRCCDPSIQNYEAINLFFAVQFSRGNKLERVTLALLSQRCGRRFLDIINAYKDVVGEVVVTSSGEDNREDWGYNRPEGFFEC